MNAEQLHDAISLLPEEMLRDVDALRQKKPFPWKSVVGLAACLCLVAGLWLLPPLSAADKSSMEAASGNSMPERGNMSAESSISDSEVTVWVDEVYAVYDDHIVLYAPDAGRVDATTKVFFDNLEEIPQFLPGQTVRIYYTKDQYDRESFTVKPYKIEIIDKEDAK